MATPPPPGYRVTSLTLPPELADYVDHQARHYGVSRAGYLRLLIARDQESRASAAKA